MSANENSSDSSRREFLGSAFLTSAGVATGLSYFFASEEEPPDLSEFDKPENQVRLGFIGVGRRGGALLRSAVKVPGNRVVAVCDVQPKMQKAAIGDIRKEYSKNETKSAWVEEVKLYSDYRKLLEDEDVEAVFIATPQYLHGPMAIDALYAGKHIYCEKAMALTIGENLDIYRLVKRNPSQVFQVGHQRHYSPLYNRVADMVHSDQIGDLVAVRAQWNRNDPVRRPCADPSLEKVINWRLYSEFSGGLSTEFASHQIDVVNWVTRTHPDAVCGFGGVDWYNDGRDTFDNIHLIFNYKVPVVKRDAFGRPETQNNKPVYVKDKYRNVKFDYMSVMQNAHLGPSELILGQYGTLEVALRGGEFFKEKKARMDPNRIAEGTNPRRGLQKKILVTGSTVDPSTAGLPRKKGKPIENKPIDPEDHWVEFTGNIKGGYDKHETLLAVGSFVRCIRLARTGKPFDEELEADVEVGLWGAVPALMANIAIRENRTVYWSEFFPDEIAGG